MTPLTFVAARRNFYIWATDASGTHTGVSKLHKVFHGGETQHFIRLPQHEALQGKARPFHIGLKSIYSLSIHITVNLLTHCDVHFSMNTGRSEFGWMKELKQNS